MVEKTKSIDKIYIDDATMQKLISAKKIELLEVALNKFAEAILKRLNDKWENSWIRIDNYPLYYIPSQSMLIVNPEKVKLDENAFISIPGFSMTGMKNETAIKLFEKKNLLVNEKGYIEYLNSDGNRCSHLRIVLEGKKYVFNTVAKYREEYRPYYSALWLSVYYLTEEEKKNIIQFVLKKKLMIFPEKEYNDLLLVCSELLKQSQIVCVGNKIRVSKDKNVENEIDNLFATKNQKLLGIDFNEKRIREEISKEKIGINSKLITDIFESILACDEKRAHMEKYPKHILKDPENGHWELWENNSGKNMVSLEEKLVARNPVYDALSNRSGVVGIDFGTKSTVVTYRQSTADVLPMRIGSGQYARVISMGDYENPTVMELKDVKRFLEAYKSKDGRPSTCWNDLLISHEAFEQLVAEQRSGDTFATFFSELKQWASDKERQVTLKDSKNLELELPPYLTLKEGDFDPIEIYAYYIGLFINNMIHKIYLRYKLSFPAKIEKSVRDKVLKSFERGIKKSLPQAVLENEECMRIFRVEQGASEPAAYAICALQEFGFEPEEDEKVYYGIFDFGGGTTDFDFGVWSSEEEDDNYDYKISRFGEGEDPYLGGENLLSMLAYEVFLDNYEQLLKDSIIFAKPYGAKEEVGREYLIRQDSQYAHFNSKRLMEKLRGVWERNDEIRKEVAGGAIQISLFNKDGEAKNNYVLNVNLDKLDTLIEKRIESGVVQFFSAFKNSFAVNSSLAEIHQIDKMNIFLAGNSCKSPIVLKLFKKHIEQLYKSMVNVAEQSDWIKIYPPLGSQQATKIQKGELEPDINAILKDIGDIKETVELVFEPMEQKTDLQELIEKIRKPNGKTGVAFGLLDNRVRIVKNEVEESGFKFYLGHNRKKKFKCIIDKDVHKYNVWKRFCSASVSEFYIWFTRSADAPSNAVPITELGIHSEVGFISEPDESKSVYIRLISPTDLEYTISELDEEQMNATSISDDMITRLTLQEKN